MKYLGGPILTTMLLLICPVIAAGQREPVERSNRNQSALPVEKLVDRSVKTTYPAASTASSRGMNDVFAITTRSIQRYNPAVTSEILAEDQKVITGAMPITKERLAKEGFSELDARDAVLFAWIFLRIGPNAIPATVAIKVQILDDQLNNMGKVVITSDPDVAQVDITAAGQNYTDHTEARLWLTATTYHITISKPGYQTVEDYCEVKKGKKTVFNRTLRPQP